MIEDAVDHEAEAARVLLALTDAGQPSAPVVFVAFERTIAAFPSYAAQSNPERLQICMPGVP
jgi:hypothetical protein